MRSQRIVWTALPVGLTADGKRLRLSALASPRLTSDADDVLGSWPDLLAWPARAAAARLVVRFAGGEAEATLVSRPDPDAWARMVTAGTPVRGHGFEDRRGTAVLAYPAAAVEADLAAVYGELAGAADGELPPTDAMRARFGPLGRALRQFDPEKLLQERRNGPADRSAERSAAGRLALAALYHTPLAAPEVHHRAADGLREDVHWDTAKLAPLPAPADFERLLEFHALVSAIGQHPRLLRLSGLVLDLEVPVERLPGGRGRLSVEVGWTPDGTLATEEDVRCETEAEVTGEAFGAVSREPKAPPLVEGFLALDERTDHQLVQVDVNGSALKLHQFALTMLQRPAAVRPPRQGGDDPVGAEPERTGAPALRSGGLTLAKAGRGDDLTARFGDSGALEDAVRNGDVPVLFAEDLVRGLVPEIGEDGTRWRSLCRRDTDLQFLADLTEERVEDEEGVVRLAASAAADGSRPDVVKLYEGLFTWSGWSLSAPPPGRAVGVDDQVRTPAPVAPTGLPVEARHAVRPRSLPSLRYGRTYRARVRVADLAGNVEPFDEARPSPKRAESAPIEYLRFEPVEAPAIAIVDKELPMAGEDLATAAIRSRNAAFDDATPSADVVRRLLAPPMASQQLAEHHGAVDGPDGRVDPSLWRMLTERDEPLRSVLHPITDKPYPSAGEDAIAPYLPDPLARTVVVRIQGRRSATDTEEHLLPWYAGGRGWPDAHLLRVEGFDPGDGSTAPVLDTEAGVIRIPLPKADHVRVRVSHALADEDLALLGIWRWARLPADAQARAALALRARTGAHWMLTPWRDLELVHAVQRPLVRPVLDQLVADRALGATVAQVRFRTPVDSRSTEKLTLSGRWLEVLDPLERARPQVAVVNFEVAQEVALERLERPGVDPPGTWVRGQRQGLRHGFKDTRYRRVGYQLAATSRHGSFIPDPAPVTDGAPPHVVVSAERITYVPNSAVPPAPDVAGVVPTFGWSRAAGRSWRTGGGLRVYLRRPWFASGSLELLAATLPRSTPDALAARHVTQWGADPAWPVETPVTTSGPDRAAFPLALAGGPIAPARLDPVIPPAEGEVDFAWPLAELPVPGAPPALRVDVAPHPVRWDAERGLWFADLVIEPGRALAPFVQLGLARYQPCSAPGAHLSAVVRSEITQLLPDRLLVLTATSPTSWHVALHGVAAPSRHVELRVERLEAGAGELGWEALPGAETGPVGKPLVLRRGGDLTEARRLLQARRFDELVLREELLELLRPPRITEATITVPRKPADGERFRLVVVEHEVRAADAHHLDPEPPPGRDPRRRPVYLEVVELT